jgi:hypothetical protein
MLIGVLLSLVELPLHVLYPVCNVFQLTCHQCIHCVQIDYPGISGPSYIFFLANTGDIHSPSAALPSPSSSMAGSWTGGWDRDSSNSSNTNLLTTNPRKGPASGRACQVTPATLTVHRRTTIWAGTTKEKPRKVLQWKQGQQRTGNSRPCRWIRGYCQMRRWIRRWLRSWPQTPPKWSLNGSQLQSLLSSMWGGHWVNGLPGGPLTHPLWSLQLYPGCAHPAVPTS